MTTINIRTEEETKSAANEVFKNLGLDMTAGIKLYLRQVIITKSIPFPLRTENGFTPEQERKILSESQELEATIKSGKAKSYDRAKDLHEDILDENI